ncbi:YggT family protein [Herminiimonas sp. CN]|uniref:YggT family protein n=1 Tax=Herminiimonas sp. CN TaxID=1349818 RepID=UPI000473D0F3|nr:YggT family protein [Herminiimonas sp. CN]
MLHGILTLVVGTVAVIVAGVLLLRFWMQAVRIRPPASIAQFVFRLSDWLVLPLRRVLPGVGGYDWACIFGAYLIAVVATAVEMLIVSPFPFQALLLLALLRLLQWAFYGWMGLLIIEAVFSWVNPHAPLAPVVRALNEPLLRPLRRIIPLIGNVDLSPLAALLLLQVALQLLSSLVLSLA